MIDLRRLRYFVVLAEELHFGRAARRLNLSQPPLSQQIHNLEQDLETKLFVRSTRSVQLTDAGRVLLERARIVLDEAEHAVALTRAVALGESGHLEIGHAPPADLQVVPRLVPRLRTTYPNIRLTLHSLRGPELIQGLKMESIRVAILRAPVQEPGLTSVVLTSEKLVAVVPDTHPLADKRDLNLFELAHEPLIFFPRWLSPSYFDTIARLCLQVGRFVFSPQQEVETSQTAIALVAAGMGISVQPASIRVIRRDGVRFVDIVDCPRCVELAAAYRKDDRSPVLRSFLEVIRALKFD